MAELVLIAGLAVWGMFGLCTVMRKSDFRDRT